MPHIALQDCVERSPSCQLKFTERPWETQIHAAQPLDCNVGIELQWRNPSLVLPSMALLGGCAIGHMLSMLVSHATPKMNQQRLIPINSLEWKQFGMIDLDRKEKI